MKYDNMKNKYTLLVILALLFAVLMSIPYLVPHFGIVALVALVPLLCMDKVATDLGVKKVWIFHYSAFVLWNAFTTFWVCNATLGGGIFAIFANAFQMSLIWSLFRFSKKHFLGILPYIFLMFTWIAWERFYFDAEISWPWLVMGNSFAQSLKTIQWFEYTGTLGGSLWIWLTNLSLFGLMVAIAEGKWFEFNIKAKFASISGLVLLIFAPMVISVSMYTHYTEKEDPIDVLIVQPNIDVYEKFHALTQEEQTKKGLDLVKGALSAHPASTLVLFPETFTGDIFFNNASLPAAGHDFRTSFAFSEFMASSTYRTFYEYLKTQPKLNFIFGAASREYFDGKAPSHNARRVRTGRWVESHNSAFLLDGEGRTEMFHKNKLVPAVEKTPYPAFFTKIDDMLGGVMGRCVGQEGVSLFNYERQDGTFVPIGPAICYESIYGEYYADYVRKGAQAMVIVTNDAWWGDTPGYKQHLHYASLRAIETRRSIARSANTGISSVINQRGEVLEQTPWWEEAVIKSKININKDITFFVKYGDVVGRISSFLFCLLLLSLLVRVFIRRS